MQGSALHAASLQAAPAGPARAARRAYRAARMQLANRACPSSLAKHPWHGHQESGVQQRARQATITHASVPSFMSLPGMEGYIEVQAVKGVRLALEGDTPRAEYLVSWKDGSEDTWEEAGNLSPDLVRDFEERWWGAARKADFDELAEMLAGGKDVLAHAVDENRRSALHFAAALGNANCVKLLLEAGSDPNLQDAQGYTPLHMAAGYMHTSSMTVLLQSGSDPQLKDNTGKDVVSLLEGIRSNMPLNLATVMQRLRLEEVANCLTDMLYEEIQALAILDERRNSDGSRELLISWADGREDSWVLERDVSASLLEDWREGMEFATAQAILDMVQVGTERRFKIKWSDVYPDSWEPEEHVPPELITLFKTQNPELFEERVAAAADNAKQQQQQGQQQGQGRTSQAAAVQSSSQALPESKPVFLEADGSGNVQRPPERVLAGTP